MVSSEKDREVAERVRDALMSKGKTLSTAESCTSGRIAAILTSVDHASEYFQGGMVVYQDELKQRFLSVDASVIAEYDVVSREVVTQMVQGCCWLFGTDYAIASTGYTGKGNERVMSGTVWIGWGKADDVRTFCINIDNGREANTSNAAETAVEKFLEYIMQYL